MTWTLLALPIAAFAIWRFLTGMGRILSKTDNLTPPSVSGQQPGEND